MSFWQALIVLFLHRPELMLAPFVMGLLASSPLVYKSFVGRIVFFLPMVASWLIGASALATITGQGNLTPENWLAAFGICAFGALVGAMFISGPHELALQRLEEELDPTPETLAAQQGA